MAAAAILDFQVMCIGPFRRVDSVVFVLCIKFRSNIDAHNYASDLHMMTSRELTSGFDFLSNPVLLIFFSKLKMAAAGILDLFG